MKKSISIIVLVIIAGYFFIQSSPRDQAGLKSGSIYTAGVKKVIDEKCYTCHSATGKSRFARNALIWDSLPGLPKGKLVATLDDIIKVVEKNKMPPAGVIKENPKMRLLPSEKQILRSWAESRADSLLK
ncbi:MAG: hypothetical protein JXB19_11500 [Bacteroidales bacterium]|nr:hypothetical protein [Bacteroidales bacterium]